MNFRSDNEAPVAEPIMQAMLAANHGFAESYGYDESSKLLNTRLSEVFEHWVEVIPLPTGTAANALAVAQTTPPYGAMYCHENAHLNKDECGAPEFFSAGAKLIDLPGKNGKLHAAHLHQALSATGAHGEHESLPAGMSLTQSTEAGTVYSLDEIQALTNVAKQPQWNLACHMDGSRFANALVHLGCTPAEMTWKSGIDLLSLGATKNGAMLAEALVIFNPRYAVEIKRRRKRAGHLVSKMRFISAQLLAWLDNDLWLRLAEHANTLAADFYHSMRDAVEFLYPVQANEAFVRLPETTIVHLQQAGFAFHVWPGSTDVVRLVFSHATDPADCQRLMTSIRESLV